MKSTLSLFFPKAYHAIFTFALAAAFFDVYYLVMKRLPGVSPDHNACIMGGSFTTGNLVFSLFLSVLAAVVIMGFWQLYRRRLAGRSVWAMGSGFGLGGLIGFFTVFCAVCTIPVVSVFGLAVGLGFFTTYNGMLKGLSLALMAFSVWLLVDKLRCERCVS